MSVNSPLSVSGLAHGDALAVPSASSRRKSDNAAFAGLMEGAMRFPAPENDQNLLKSKTIDALRRAMTSQAAGTSLVARATLSGEAALSGAKTPTETGETGTVRPLPALPVPNRGRELQAAEKQGGESVVRGIALPDRSRGIALDMPLGLSQRGARNVAMNRTFPTAERLAGVGRTSGVSRRSAARNKGGEMDLGQLSARFESGKDGISAIGYDRSGGTSYGKYQIASRPGTMSSFLNFLDKAAPDLASRLRSAGPANTGSREGEMPRVWKEIAAQEPERFEELQENFIRASHYEPAMAAVRRMGYKTGNFSAAMKEVVFSTAVQHGVTGASRIFQTVAEKLGSREKDQERMVIREVYDLRAERFESSSPSMRSAARNRMATEKDMALAMTGEEQTA